MIISISRQHLPVGIQIRHTFSHPAGILQHLSQPLLVAQEKTVQERLPRALPHLGRNLRLPLFQFRKQPAHILINSRFRLLPHLSRPAFILFFTQRLISGQLIPQCPRHPLMLHRRVPHLRTRTITTLPRKQCLAILIAQTTLNILP